MISRKDQIVPSKIQALIYTPGGMRHFEGTIGKSKLSKEYLSEKISIWKK